MHESTSQPHPAGWTSSASSKTHGRLLIAGVKCGRISFKSFMSRRFIPWAYKHMNIHYYLQHHSKIGVHSIPFHLLEQEEWRHVILNATQTLRLLLMRKFVTVPRLLSMEDQMTRRLGSVGCWSSQPWSTWGEIYFKYQKCASLFLASDKQYPFMIVGIIDCKAG